MNSRVSELLLAGSLLLAAFLVGAQEGPVADPASIAFEEGRWEDAIVEYRIILDEYPEDRLSRLRIAQAERELERHEAALRTLEAARVASAPEAMVEFERARNLVALGREDEGMQALEEADDLGLRALELVQTAEDLDPIRDREEFELVALSVRARVYPCEHLSAANDFDFWIGRWEVRMPNGTLVGHNTISRTNGGCSIEEHWDGAGGSAGTSLSFYIPSQDLWRQVWVGSGGTLIDMSGGLVEGEMRMEGTIEYAEQGRIVAFRGAWSRSPDGRVRQRLEEFNVANGSWSVWFDGFYRRLD